MTPEDLGGILMRGLTPVPERLHDTGALARTADWYAHIGMPIFPCYPHRKTPATAHGYQDATTNPDHIRDWWRHHPAHNIAHPTGTWFDVIDVDGDKGGVETAYTHADQLPEPVAVAATGTGWHLYVPPDSEQVNAARAAGDWKGIDFRTSGGYILVPPSRHPNGRLYQWLLPPPRCHYCGQLLTPAQVLADTTHCTREGITP